jgi:hypothetical protein
MRAFLYSVGVVGFSIALYGCERPPSSDLSSERASDSVRQVSTDIQHKIADYVLSRYSRGAEFRTSYDSIMVRQVGDSNLYLAYVNLSEFCGSSGCHLAILRRSSDNFESLGLVARVQLPVRSLPESRNGLPVIAVWVSGGGTMPGYESALPFDGRNYPSNPDARGTWRTSPLQRGEVIMARGERGQPL